MLKFKKEKVISTHQEVEEDGDVVMHGDESFASQPTLAEMAGDDNHDSSQVSVEGADLKDDGLVETFKEGSVCPEEVIDNKKDQKKKSWSRFIFIGVICAIIFLMLAVLFQCELYDLISNYDVEMMCHNTSMILKKVYKMAAEKLNITWF